MSSVDSRPLPPPSRFNAIPFIVLSGLVIAVTPAILGALPWCLGWFPMSARELAKSGNIESLMTPNDGARAAVRLVAGLLALPGLWALGRARVPEKYRRDQQWLLIAAVAWPVLAATEVAFRQLSAASIPGANLFHSIEVIATGLAFLLILRARGRERVDASWLLLGSFVALHLLAPRVGPMLPFEARVAVGLMILVATAAVGGAVARLGAKLLAGGARAEEPSAAGAS